MGGVLFWGYVWGGGGVVLVFGFYGGGLQFYGTSTFICTMLQFYEGRGEPY